jgi:hypothetical protein
MVTVSDGIEALRQIDTYIPSDYRGVKYNFYFKMGVGAKFEL